MLLREPLHLLEGGRDLVAFDEPIELLEITRKIRTAELDFLAWSFTTTGLKSNMMQHEVSVRTIFQVSGPATSPRQYLPF